MERPSPSPARPGYGWGFGFTLAVYLLLTGGHLYGTDGVHYFLMTDGLWTHGSPAIPEEGIATGGGSRGVDGKYYSPFTLGQPILMLPWYVAGAALEGIFPANYARSLTVSTFNAFVTAALVTAVASAGVTLGFSVPASWLCAWVFGFTSMALPYSRYDYTEPLFTLALFAAFLAVLRRKEWIDSRSLAGVGACLALSILVRPVGLVIGLPVIGYTLWQVWRQREVEEREVGKLAFGPDAPAPHWMEVAKTCLIPIGALAVPVAAALLWTLGYNYSRFGSLFDSGYRIQPNGLPRSFTSPAWWGLAVMLLSPGKSFFLFNPTGTLALWDVRKAWSRFREETALGLALFIALLALYATWCRPEGGYTWGPRFLLTALPFLCLFLLPRIEVAASWRTITDMTALKRMAFPLILASLFGVFVQGIGIGVNFAQVIEENESRYYAPPLGHYRFSFFPWSLHISRIIAHMGPGHMLAERDLGEVVKDRNSSIISVFQWNDSLDSLWLHLWRDRFPGWFTFGVPVLLIGGGGACLWFLVAPWSPPKERRRSSVRRR